ncbi:sugar nucleotidyltransferase [Helicobacter didelphidarum]|uniref:Sugar nucleotidyltransferase n=1 Tax=Helicobacter didelphidarum TaxID=2040648 RepID=A0A3D8IP65_9HELI|nr:phosphocholine cytidylyltransferase family protein [Helicobacter didelphidarum]RDU67012.1 sugar nucleotidyltransferase [Helicobacter didelphidarum]
MRALILAAGFGSRLMPLTKDMPKCMVVYQGRKIIDYILIALEENDIKEISIVGGYKIDVLKEYLKGKTNLTFYENKIYEKSNMLYTLFCAKEFLRECVRDKKDLLISYADIVYFKESVEKLKNCGYDLGIIVDRRWKELWERRFSNPLSDAETLKLHGNTIIELGKKPKSYNEIEGQYIGLFKISSEFLSKVIDFYENLSCDILYDGKDFQNMYMTSFLQLLIERFNNATMVEIFGNWCEIDFKSDLDVEYIKG